MENQERFLKLLQESLQSIREPRLYETERGFQGELLAQLRGRIAYAQFPGEPIVEQEYQKTIPSHGLGTRPDIIVHIPFERGGAERRNQGNFVAIELKLRATQKEAADDFAKLAAIREALAYPLTIFINIGSDETCCAYCPKVITGKTVCFAVRLEDGNPVVTMAGPVAKE